MSSLSTREIKEIDGVNMSNEALLTLLNNDTKILAVVQCLG